ncbi:transposable element Tc3 transposase [Trichonephila clavipes]|nr:transposable element Tc3 transposase [Trichonephila clavipes]
MSPALPLDLLSRSRPPLQTHVPNTTNIRVPDRVEWAQNEIAVVPDFHKRILVSDEAHFWLNGYVNKQNCRIWREANPQVYVETPLHPEKLTVWCSLWAGGILLQKR